MSAMEVGKKSRVSELITTMSHKVLNNNNNKERTCIEVTVTKEKIEKTEKKDKVKAATRYLIRKGRVQDCAQISVLMRKLAESEDYGDRVEVSEEDLREDGFGEHPVFESIVLEDREPNEEGESILGYALYFMGFCSWKGRLLYLEDIYVNQKIRGTGLGLALLNVIGKISEERRCKAIQGTVVEWNTEVMTLYKRIGARDMTEHEKYHLVAIGRSEIQRFARAKIPVMNNGSQIVTYDV